MPPIISLDAPLGTRAAHESAADRDLEAKLIRHASPTLAGIKPANLFTWRAAYGASEEADAAIGNVSTRLAHLGVRITRMAQRDAGALLLVWRASLVADALASPDAKAILEEANFKEHDADGVIAELKDCIAKADEARLARIANGAEVGEAPMPKRIVACCAGDSHKEHHHAPGHVCQCRARAALAREEAQATMGEAEFPHEIGLVLGYPPADVSGFIRHKGANFLACGGWKAYSDPEAALRTFQRNRFCAEECRKLHTQGVSLEAICDMRGTSRPSDMFALLKAAV